MKYKKSNKYNTIFLILIICILLAILLFIVYKKNKCIIKEKYTTQYKYTAIIVEPREHKALSFVLSNFLENLSDEWGIVICHGNKNIDFIHTIINNDISQYRDRITLVNLMVDNLTIDDYNKLLMSEKFYEYIPTETFIVFQTDTMICPEYKEYIHKFLEYDYVGAPWGDGSGVGNGGLSLRKKSKMLEKIKKCNNDLGLWEDRFFSYECADVTLKKPSNDIASEFSIETTYNDKSWGVHKFWAYNSSENIESKKKFCKGIDTLISLQ